MKIYEHFIPTECSYCGGKGYIEIHNAYDPHFLKIEECPFCINEEKRTKDKKSN